MILITKPQKDYELLDSGLGKKLERYGEYLFSRPDPEALWNTALPADTWKNRPGGMRADLVQLLPDLKPGFIRFPGGCIVEGYDLSTRYQWKKTK